MNTLINLPTTKWAGDDYPVIAELSNGYKLVAHKNAPAITNGDLFSTLSQHEDDEPHILSIKKQAYDKFEKWIWKLVIGKLNPPKYPNQTTTIPEYPNNEIPELNEEDTDKLRLKLTEAIGNQLNHEIHEISNLTVEADETSYEITLSLRPETLSELITQDESHALIPGAKIESDIMQQVKPIIEY